MTFVVYGAGAVGGVIGARLFQAGHGVTLIARGAHYEAIRDRGLQENSDMFVFLDSIAGHEFGRTRPEPNVGHTPAWKSLVAQDAVEEEILRDHVAHCVEHAISSGDKADQRRKIAELMDVVGRADR